MLLPFSCKYISAAAAFVAHSLSSDSLPASEGSGLDHPDLQYFRLSLPACCRSGSGAFKGTPSCRALCGLVSKASRHFGHW